MKIVIPGGAGFLGIALVELLVSQKHEVLVMDDLAPNALAVQKAGAKHWPFDILHLENHDLKIAFSGVNVVLNLVGRTWHEQSLSDPVGDAKANVLAPLQVLHAASLFCPSAHIIYAGSRSQYGKITTRPVDESHPTKPVDINGIHKQAAEDAHMLFAKQFGLSVTSLRLPNIVGPRHQTQTHDGVVNWMLWQAAQGKSIHASPRIRDILHTSEVVDAFILAMGNPACFGRIFNIGGRAIPLTDYARMIAEIMPTEVCVLEKESLVEVGDYEADASAFRAATGWSPSPRPFKDLLAETAVWYQEKAKNASPVR